MDTSSWPDLVRPSTSLVARSIEDVANPGGKREDNPFAKLRR
jgi:hypothetical protein